MVNVFLEEKIERLSLDKDVVNKLNTNDIHIIKDLWFCNRKNLKIMNFTDRDINEIIIKMQLKGIDLNKKIY